LCPTAAVVALGAVARGAIKSIKLTVLPGRAGLWISRSCNGKNKNSHEVIYL